MAPPYKDPPAPPPYRDPPPPSSSIYHKKNLAQVNMQSHLIKVFIHYLLFFQDISKNHKDKDDDKNKFHENVLYNAQYRELVALINYQREKLTNQQADLTKVCIFY